MARNGSGVYSLPTYLAVTGEKILAARHNGPLEDIAAEITASLPRAGTAAMTGALNMGSNQITAVSDPTTAQHAATKAYVDAMALTDGDKGDITVATSGASFTIDANAVTLPKMAQLATNGFIGNDSGGAADPQLLTATEATALIDVMGADAGAGALKGLAPPPAAGDAVKALLGDADYHLAEDIDATKSLAADGYVKLPGGAIIQWGFITIGATSSGTETLPTAFTSSTSYGVTANQFENNTTDRQPIKIGSKSASQFTMQNTNNASAGINWIAIGY